VRWWQGAVLQQRLSEPDTAALARRRAAASSDEARVRQARIAAVVCTVLVYCSLLPLQATTKVTKGRRVVEDKWSGWWCLWPGGSS
jgi:hypothetical protein